MKFQLALYYFDQCPYCQIVLRKINELGLKQIEFRNIMENSEHAEKLMQDTGKRTVPCLYINDIPKHESTDIAQWLEDNKADLQ